MMVALLLWHMPPLPVLSEVSALAGFATTCLDDAAEDAVKLAAAVVVSESARLTLGSRRAGAVMRYLLPGLCWVALVAALYPHLDAIADSFGDRTGGALQAILRQQLGMPVEVELPPQNDRFILDDVVEDGFKFSCVWSHYRMG